MASLDIDIAFDAMLHGVLEGALRWRGVHPMPTHNILRKLSGLKAMMHVAGCEATTIFPFTRGGTGPFLNVIVEYLLHATVALWSERALVARWMEILSRT